MTKPITIDAAQARRFLLRHQGLLPPRQLKGKTGVLQFIRRANCIQYDPINVVGQNPHLVLQSRVRGYRPAMLDELLYTDRRLVDGFDKQMSIYPVEDWPQFGYYRHTMAKTHVAGEHTAEAVRLLERVKGEVATRGPISSLELEEDTRMDWWLAGSVRAVRIALDILLYRGDTVVHHRVGTRRYFDLTERVLPRRLVKAARAEGAQDEYLEWHVHRRVGGLGLVDLRITSKFGGMLGWRGGRIRAALLRLVEQGRLVPVAMKQLPRQRFFVRPEDLAALDAAASRYRGKPQASFIAPLDNLMWDLNMVEMLFGFEYAWEVYKRADQRDYGYYVLPVLYGDRFVARMDPHFDRASGTLTLQGWWWEREVDRGNADMSVAIGECLGAFARYLGATKVRLGPKVRRDRGLVKAALAWSPVVAEVPESPGE